MEKLTLEELPRPALLDPNFANQVVSRQQNDSDTSNVTEVDPYSTAFSIGLVVGQDAFLEQRELQQIRGLLKSFINVLQQEVRICKHSAHAYHEMSDKLNPDTTRAFKMHSLYRKRAQDAAKILRSMERIQRKIRLQLSGG